jgi:hypothetical protein
MPLEPSSDLPPLGQDLSASSNLGSLAQSARAKELKSARVILIIVGVLFGGSYCFLFSNIANEVNLEAQKQIDGLRAKGLAPDPVSLAEYRQRCTTFGKIFYGSGIALGVIFILMGLAVYAFPIPITILGLVLFIGHTAVIGYLNPMTLVQGWILKIVFVVSLVKAIQAAVAYQKS